MADRASSESWFEETATYHERMGSGRAAPSGGRGRSVGVLGLLWLSWGVCQPVPIAAVQTGAPTSARPADGDEAAALFEIVERGVRIDAGHLPLDGLSEAFGRLNWGLSSVPGRVRVFYLPAPSPSSSGPDRSVAEPSSRHPARWRIDGSTLGAERAAGGGGASSYGDVPRSSYGARIWLSEELFGDLFESSGATAVTLRPFEHAVDVVTQLFTALLEAVLLESELDSGRLDRLLVGRARLGPVDSAVLSRTQYAQVVADYVGHVLALLNSIDQWVDRQGGPGAGPCRVLEREIGLAVAWQRALSDASFVVDRPSPSGRSAAPSGRPVPVELTLEERRGMLAELLDVTWSGVPVEDLRMRVCTER